VNIVKKLLNKTFFDVRKKKFNKILYLQIIPLILIGYAFGVISIWPGIISGNNRRCFSNILKDGRDGSVKVSTLLSINPNYLVKIKNTKNKYLKILLIGDSCFRSFK
tara:strand:+ start:442 stop:762 length:321 start_codon:yes stop_codon:yes gene_type:complete